MDTFQSFVAGVMLVIVVLFVTSSIAIGSYFAGLKTGRCDGWCSNQNLNGEVNGSECFCIEPSKKLLNAGAK